MKAFIKGTMVVLTVSAFTTPAARADIIVWKSDWTLTRWWDTTRPPPANVDTAKEAFGASATKDMEIKDVATMPGIGKVVLATHRVATDTIAKEGGIFTRTFMVSEKADVTAIASFNSTYIATGKFVRGDFINGDDTVSVEGQAKVAHAFDQDAMLTAGTFGLKSSKRSEEMVLEPGNLYTLTFNFSVDERFIGGTDKATLSTSLFEVPNAFTANLTAEAAVARPEPSTLVLVVTATLALALRAIWLGRLGPGKFSRMRQSHGMM
jgi:hypothetical protein